MRDGMCESVGFFVVVVEGDEDAEVVDAGGDADGGAGEFSRDLVVAVRGDAFFGAFDPEGADGGVVRGLLC